jgi:hypothetical protein
LEGTNTLAYFAAALMQKKEVLENNELNRMNVLAENDELNKAVLLKNFYVNNASFTASPSSH